MGWDAREITDTDTRRAIDKQIREEPRKNCRFFKGIFIVRLKINDLLIDVSQHLFGNPCKPAFRISHRPRGVVVDTTEVSLSIYERVAHIKRLRHTDKSAVNRPITVWMIVLHHLPNDSGTFVIGAVRCEIYLAHSIDNPTRAGFEPVTYIRYRAIGIDTHRVGEIRRFQFIFYVAFLDVFHGYRLSV